MPAVILGTQMERGPVKWRVVTSGLEDAGPGDKTLVIQFDGELAALDGFSGHSLDIAEFRQSCSLARQDWIPAEGVYPCATRLGSTHSVSVTFP